MTKRAVAASQPLHPARELLARYGTVFKAAWGARRELAGPTRMADETAFLPAALSLQETPAHPAPRRLAIAICTLFVIALVWSIVGEIDIVAVASGRIIVSDRTKVIQPLETSVIKRVLVKDGDVVEAGQVLVELDATNATADGTSVRDQLAAASNEERRTAALMVAVHTNQPPVWEPVDVESEVAFEAAQLQAEWQDISAKLAKLVAERARRVAEIATVRELIGKLEATLPITQQRETDFLNLAARGFIAGYIGQDRTRERIEQERDLAMQRARLVEARAALTETDKVQRAYVAETLRSLSDRNAQATLKRQQLTQERSKAEQRSRLMQLTTPVAGTVQQVTVHTEGGVVTPAQALMVIVPRAAQVIAEVVIDNKDIGFVRAGQEARIKLETFPFTRYGTVDAVVHSVTADAVNDEKRGAIFPATIALNQTSIDADGRRIALSAGMNVTAEVRTGKRRVIDYLLSPVRRAADEGLGER